jgi:hypothetical protein
MVDCVAAKEKFGEPEGDVVALGESARGFGLVIVERDEPSMSRTSAVKSRTELPLCSRAGSGTGRAAKSSGASPLRHSAGRLKFDRPPSDST